MKNEIIVYEGTVRKMVVEVRKENLTKNGYFDLGKLLGLRIIASDVLKTIRKDFQITQKELSRLIGVSFRTYIGWEYYKKGMPFNKLENLAKELKINKETLLERVNGEKFTFGEHHGKNRITLPTKPHDFELARYMIPNKNYKTYLVKSAPENVKKHIIDNFSIDKIYFGKSRLISIYSYLLNTFLRTFYRYKLLSKLNFPLSSHVIKWKNKVDLTKSVILPILLSDGGEKPRNRFYCSGESKSIHNIWSDALYYTNSLLPSSYMNTVKNKTIFITTHKLDQRSVNLLRSLCPSFKTSPYKQKKSVYMNSPQPTINSILKAKPLEQKIAIRIWFCAEGSIMIKLDRRTNVITPILTISCAHPYLIKELKRLLGKNGIRTSIRYEKTYWSGVSRLYSSSIHSAINFLKIGGFIDGVKITRKSEYYHGIDKQDVFLSIFELMIRQRENPGIRTSNLGKIHKQIRKIALNKEFKIKEHYIKYFGD